MYVIFKKGSRQYRVQEGDEIDMDLLDAEKGSHVLFEEVLFVGDDKEPTVGLPCVKGFQVKCEVLGESKGPKVVSMKYQPSHNQVKSFGHRQRYTRVKVVGISKDKKN